MTAFSIRDVQSPDAPAISRLCTQLGYPVDESSMPDRIARLASDANARAFVALNDSGDIVGLETVHLRHTLNHPDPLAQITLLVVDEASRGQGAGQVLVGAAEQWARERRCARIVVTTALQRADAHRFYEKAGYAHTGRRYGKDFPHRQQ